MVAVFYGPTVVALRGYHSTCAQMGVIFQSSGSGNGHVLCVSRDTPVCKADNGLEGPVLQQTFQLNFSKFGSDNRGERCLSNRQTRELM